MKKINFKKLLTEDYDGDRIRFRESKGAAMFRSTFFLSK